ncbi:uncharacterized protein LOC110673760 [Hevea brasiliensis]|uniref:uncharacterized protein LOC110673760 n=1 Tax=Hevea brasiliensis TaxID=3981 RepID=UPI0025F77BED|nr:uncharacterized protein LOC110673760 [Hevea brasiliensis]XP_021692636.2 uncharacterized protein LOC110673760 [Hevea brasiliensis]XP_021692637.2 uncharacterized protein LOC110673760 [Hevea brasiliensis]XP_021692638.2 uncharacterized protein LOC110673760 [Hevea brasiliensis]
MLLLGNVDQQHYNALDRAGIKTGINSRFTFETTIREKDTLLAELVARPKHGSEVSQSALSLAKKRGLTDLSYARPPLLNQCNGSAIGLTVRKSNVTASMAQSVSGFVVQPCSDGIGQCFNTFGQIVCQLPRGIKLSLSGVHQVPRLSSQHVKLGALTIPVAFLKHHKALETMIDASAPLIETNTLQTFSTGSIAMNVETELDENTRIGGWIEMNKSNPKQLQWAVNLFNDSEDESGWGMFASGITVEGSNNWTHLQAESYLKLNMGNKFSITPGIEYAMDGNAREFLPSWFVPTCPSDRCANPSLFFTM